MLNLMPWRKDRGKSQLVESGRDNPIVHFRDEFESLFNRFWNQLPVHDQALGRGSFWGFEVQERDNEVVVLAEAPGFEANDFEVEITDNLLKIKAERHRESNGKREAQREHVSFQRVTTLPTGTLPDEVEATYRNGVLEVHVPKSEERKGRRVPVATQ